MSENVFIALGSNLGDRHALLKDARSAIGSLPGTFIVAESDVDETEPLGAPGQGKYLNQMIVVRTSLEPEVLLDELLAIERKCGRVRGERWGPRTLDLDIVRYGSRESRSDRLAIPHPELPNRDFWLRELRQLEERM